MNGKLYPEDHEFLVQANEIRKFSPDPSSQIGVCIVLAYVTDHGEGTIRDFNRFPDGIAPRLERPEKYTFIEHAERNAIYTAARKGIALEGATLYMVGMGPPSGPCEDCARACIQAGIKRVVAIPYKGLSPHWDKGVGIGTAMLLEAGIDYVEVPSGELFEQ